MNPVNFEEKFRLYAMEQLRDKSELSEDEAEEFAHELYHRWMELPQDWLEGKKPSEYFDGCCDPVALIDLVGQYLLRDWEIPEPLLDRLMALCKEDFAPILEAVRNRKRPDVLRAVLLGMLSNLDCPETEALCEKAILSAAGESEISEIAVEILSYEGGEESRKRLIQGYPAANDYAKLLILDVLCNYPGDPRVYSYCVERLFADPENRALYANYLVKLGDERAVEPLKRLLELSDLGYLDYLELRNAVEALGGDPGEERTFYGDPDYEAIRNL